MPFREQAQHALDNRVVLRRKPFVGAGGDGDFLHIQAFRYRRDGALSLGKDRNLNDLAGVLVHVAPSCKKLCSRQTANRRKKVFRRLTLGRNKSKIGATGAQASNQYVTTKAEQNRRLSG